MVFARGYALRREARNHPPNHHQCRSVAIPIAEYTAPEQRRGRRPLSSLTRTSTEHVVVLYVPAEMEEHYGSVSEVLRVLLCSTVPGWDWERDTSPDGISSALASAASRQGFIPYGNDGHVAPERGPGICGKVVPVRFRREI